MSAAVAQPNTPTKSGAGRSNSASSRRGSVTLQGRRGSGVEQRDSHVVSWHTSTHKHEKDTGAREEDLKKQLERFTQLFTITPQRLRMITDNFVGVLEDGLAQDGQTVPMLPTFVFGWPTGEELGSYLALDLGGTNLRVCHVVLKGEGKFEVTQTKFRLTDEQKQEDGQKLFDFCAECLHRFIKDHFGDGSDEGVILEENISLGFTFSYPMEQEKIDHGRLVRWTKGFGNPNTEGKDVAAMFRKALEKYDVPIKMTSLINDTTGTLIASNYVRKSTKIACIFGTGCNAAYMEHISEIPKIKHLGLPEDAEMAINCEYGAFDSFKHEHLAEVRTKYDETIDLTSNKPHEQAYEKMIAGLYLGEIFRLVLCDLVDEGVIFLGQNTYKIEKAYVFDTAFLSLMEADPTPEFLTVTGLFTHFFGLDTTMAERQFFRDLAKLIGTRAARLSSCGIAAIVTKMKYLEDGSTDEIGVGADGSLFSKYPGFKDRLEAALLDIFGEKGKRIKTYQAEDGSGVGSAIIAAMTRARLEDGIFTHV
ncbi:hexokinase [Tilletia horrida]|uniref:Phosphotransferase n=1 Tax=Tilletia horrida TaxID=155126 RepID=A0AAN6GFZ4_9BASI|nr:hexokinase [Tilletia horrida]KAK0559393.1 hexokinase [Tilletia horrida]